MEWAVSKGGLLHSQAERNPEGVFDNLEKPGTESIFLALYHERVDLEKNRANL